MIEVKFDEIWNTAIKPYLNRELSLDGSLQCLDVTENGTKARRDIESLYDTARNDIKRNYMKDSGKLLDRHKIPACIYCAIAEAPLLLSFMADGADAEYSKYLETNGLTYPQGKNIDSNESYIVQTLKELCYAQKQKRLSVLMLANIFFLLEVHTDLFYRSLR